MVKKAESDPAGCVGDVIAMNDALKVLGGKWTLLIIHYLIARADEVNTFKKIERDIDGISAKVLTQELKYLESNDIITREELPTKPISVAYSISTYGKSGTEVIQVLVRWGLNHRLKVFNATEGK